MGDDPAWRIPQAIDDLDPIALKELLAWLLEEESSEDSPRVIKTRWAELKAQLDRVPD